MRLIGRGIDESRIIVEDKSISTRENLALAKPLIEAAGGELSKDRVLIVSSYFHLYRASLYAASEGYDNTEYLGSAGLVLLKPHYY